MPRVRLLTGVACDKRKQKYIYYYLLNSKAVSVISLLYKNYKWWHNKYLLIYYLEHKCYISERSVSATSLCYTRLSYLYACFLHPIWRTFQHDNFTLLHVTRIYHNIVYQCIFHSVDSKRNCKKNIKRRSLKSYRSRHAAVCFKTRIKIVFPYSLKYF